jgi:hypothetical protein
VNKLSKVKNALDAILNCPSCWGLGVVGWCAPEGDYDYDFCECNPHSIPADEVMEYNRLFSLENA